MQGAIGGAMFARCEGNPENCLDRSRDEAQGVERGETIAEQLE